MDREIIPLKKSVLEVDQMKVTRKSRSQMIKIERLIDPYPGSSFMILAERARYESPDEKAKDPSLPQISFNTT